jgi:hypothetical protein
MNGERASVPEYRARRSEKDASSVIFDANCILRASQLHVRPERPEIVELIETEIKNGTNLISHIQDAYLIVGYEPIKAVQLNQGTTTEVTIEPRTELVIEGVLVSNGDSEEKTVVVLQAGGQLLHILPNVLASTLVQGGVILSQMDGLQAK